MNSVLQNANGPAAIAVAPGHGSIHPSKDKEMNRWEHSTAAAGTPLLSQAFRIVRDMEDDLASVQDLLDVLARLAETFDSQDGACVQRVAWIARDVMKSAETKRGNLFRLTHPSREDFEAAGWPA